MADLFEALGTGRRITAYLQSPIVRWSFVENAAGRPFSVVGAFVTRSGEDRFSIHAVHPLLTDIR